MKIKNLKSFLHIAVLIFFSSCASTKQINKDYDKEIMLGRDPGSPTFIIKKNGEKIEGKVIIVSPVSAMKVRQRESWITIDGQKIHQEDIFSYQTTNGCYSFYEYDTVVSIYRFYPRVRYGKINLYYHSNVFRNTAQGPGAILTVNYNDYFFEKEKGKLILFTFKKFYDAVIDNPEAVKKLNQVFPRAKIPHNDYIENLQKLASVVDVYNK